MRFVGPNISTDGLIYYFDAANPKSYVSGSTVSSNLLPTPISGALVNGPIFLSENKGSLSFNGTDEYILIESSSVYNIISGSLEIWCRTNDMISALGQQFLTRGNGAIAGNFNLLKVPDSQQNKWAFRVRVASSTQITVTSSLAADTNWVHLVGTFTNNTASLYVNGIYDEVGYIVGDAYTVEPAQYGICVNVTGTAVGGNYANGSVALAKIYNRALTPDEILKNYNATKDRFI